MEVLGDSIDFTLVKAWNEIYDELGLDFFPETSSAGLESNFISK